MVVVFKARFDIIRVKNRIFCNVGDIVFAIFKNIDISP